jgi:hypothetical protein
MKWEAMEEGNIALSKFLSLHILEYYTIFKHFDISASNDQFTAGNMYGQDV